LSLVETRFHNDKSITFVQIDVDVILKKIRKFSYEEKNIDNCYF